MRMNVRIGDKTYQVRVGDPHARPVRVDVDGEVFEVWPEDRHPSADVLPAGAAQPSISPAMPPIASAGSSSPCPPEELEARVLAPIPGVIVELLVSPGDEVAYGQELCVLEAMKMKNSIRSGRAGVIERVLVAVGDQVSQNQPLIVFSAEGA